MRDSFPSDKTHVTTDTTQAIQPTVSPTLVRRMPVVVGLTLIGTAVVIAGLVLATQNTHWWRPYAGATGIATLGAIASIVIIVRSAGKPADYVVTMIMALSAVRMFISLFGLLILVMGLKMLAEPTAFMICGFYMTTLLVESLLVSRSLKAGN